MSTSDLVQEASIELDLEPGLVCGLCGTCWNRPGGLKRLADVDCPNCHASYAHVGVNREP